MGARITENEFGIIDIHRDVLARLVVDKIADMDAFVVPCNKKGKPLKRKMFSIDDLENSVDVKINNRNEITVRVYLLSRFGESINQISNELFDSIESEFEKLSIAKPKTITAYIKGVMAKQIIERNIEVTRHNG